MTYPHADNRPPASYLAARRDRVAMLAALARLGLPLDLPPGVGIQQPAAASSTVPTVPLLRSGGAGQ